MIENLYFNIFCVIGIIAFSMLIVWLGYKLYHFIKRKMLSSINENPVVDYHRSLNFYRDENSIETLNETKVIYRRNHLVHRCSDTGIL